MGCQVTANGVYAVFHEQEAVELALDLRVGHFSKGRQVVDIAMAGAVQGIMAEKAAQIGVVRLAGTSFKKCFSGFREILSSGEPVHAAALAVDRVMREGLVIEQNIGTVQADVEQGFLLQQDLLIFVGERSQHILSEAIMGVG